MCMEQGNEEAVLTEEDGFLSDMKCHQILQDSLKIGNNTCTSVTQDIQNLGELKEKQLTVQSGDVFVKKQKQEKDCQFKPARKRSQVAQTGTGKFFPPYKRRKKEGIIRPTKFLLGGNIYDPLNLNSLQDEEINRAMNAVTPKSSPLPTPKHRKGEVEVIIPPNINDPLNLIDCEDNAKYEEQLISPTKKVRKSRNRKRKRNSSSGGSVKDDSTESVALEDASGKDTEDSKKNNETTVSETVSDVSEAPLAGVVQNLQKRFDLVLKDKEKTVNEIAKDNVRDFKLDVRNKKNDVKDKIVSPVIPQPGAWKRPPYSYRGNGNNMYSSVPGNRYRQKKNKPQKMPKFQEKNARFQYGNYSRYYGYRNPAHEEDPRLKYFIGRSDIFFDKDILDIGCNIGHITLSVARDLGVRSIVGLDIDQKLIEIARKNVKHYMNGGSSSRLYPVSMPIIFGDVDICCNRGKTFPHNVTFIQGNYVLETDVLLQTERAQFDVILCLSLTKWLHLNWGDNGLKRAFKRMYAQLRPGGRLILEVQPWDSYKRKKSLTEKIYKNYGSIEFYPDKFTQYLLSSEVGFKKCEVIGVPYHPSKGFQRPLQMFTKSEVVQSSSATNSAAPPVCTATSAAVSSVDASSESDNLDFGRHTEDSNPPKMEVLNGQNTLESDGPSEVPLENEEDIGSSSVASNI